MELLGQKIRKESIAAMIKQAPAYRLAHELMRRRIETRVERMYGMSGTARAAARGVVTRTLSMPWMRNEKVHGKLFLSFFEVLRLR